jgi:hypothetical protein
LARYSPPRVGDTAGLVTKLVRMYFLREFVELTVFVVIGACLRTAF